MMDISIQFFDNGRVKSIELKNLPANENVANITNLITSVCCASNKTVEKKHNMPENDDSETESVASSNEEEIPLDAKKANATPTRDRKATDNSIVARERQWYNEIARYKESNGGVDEDEAVRIATQASAVSYSFKQQEIHP